MAGRQRWWRLGTLGVMAMALLTLGLASAGAPVAMAHAARAADATPVQQAVTLDSPAVVRIVSVVAARLTCAKCASDGSDIVSPPIGSDPFTYFSSGSGAFISPTGAILTADHVVDHSVNNPEDVIFVEQQAADEIAHRFPNTTADVVLSSLQSHPSQVSIDFIAPPSPLPSQPQVFLSTQYTGQITNTNQLIQFSMSAIVASSPPAPLGQDTAIIRLDTSQIKPGPDFPYLTLSNSSVQALDSVTAIAYPAESDQALNSNADFTALLDTANTDAGTLSSLLTASVNPGQITKVDSGGYETTGIASQGSSGGPVINDQGQVIGFVDRGSTDGLVTAIIPSSVVAGYTTKAGLANPAPGRFMTLWSKAVSDYYATGTCHYASAASDFATLNKQYPQFGGAKALADDARLKAAGESCATGGTSTTGATGDVTAGFLIIGGCLLAVLALIAGVIFLIVALARRRSKPAPVMTPVAQAPAYMPPAPAGPPPPIVYRQQSGPVYPAAAPPPAQPVAQPPMPATLQSPAPAPQTPPNPYPPAGPAPHPPVLSAPLGPTRFCPNGHVVLEADATFCPICGSLMAPTPDR